MTFCFSFHTLSFFFVLSTTFRVILVLSTFNNLTQVPSSLRLWEEDEKAFTPCQRAMHAMLAVQALRADRLPAAAMEFVATTLGRDFVRAAEGEVDLGMVVETQIQPATPILMCSVPGYDASSRVDDLATELGKPLTSITIYSGKGFCNAEVAINTIFTNSPKHM